MGFLFGSGGSAPQAFRAPGWEQQGQLLNQLFLSNALGANPQLLEQQRQGIAAQEAQLRDLQAQLGDTPVGIAQNPGQLQNRRNPQNFQLQQQINDLNRNIAQQRSQFGFFQDAQKFQPQGFTPGQEIPGQIGPTVAQSPWADLNFQQRTPFQFQAPQQGFQYNLTPFDANRAVQDAFTPQAENIQNILARQGNLQDLAIKEDMNRRGLLTAGATTQALGERQRSTNDALANALASLGANQAQAQLGASQFGAQNQLAQQQALYGQDFARQQQDYQRQLSQAEELFRQQGATDQQATSMAQNALQKQAQQLAAQQALFGQQIQGRQQGLQEFGVQNQLQRQPIEDLLKLFSFSTGGNPGTPAQPGLLQALAPAAGTALFGAFCLPKGTKIETENGEVNVEDVSLGDQVKGGKVIAVTWKKRPRDHYFSRHKFETGEVVMTLGHPFYDRLISHKKEEIESDNTYDIQTDSGFYYVNKVKLGSTLGGFYGI